MQVLKGHQIKPYSKAIVELLLTVFKEPPYLYEGTVEEYLPFVEIYANSADGIACLLFENKKLVGVVTGVPLQEMPERFRTSFGNQCKTMYYLGEMGLVKEYQKQKLGTLLYSEFEKQIPPGFDTLCFCKISEPNNTFDPVLEKYGFVEEKKHAFEGVWRNIGELIESPHEMDFWTKQLKS